MQEKKKVLKMSLRFVACAVGWKCHSLGEGTLEEGQIWEDVM